MNKSPVFSILLIVTSLFAVACTPAEPPTQEVAAVELSVEVKTSEGSDKELIANGQKITVWADSNIGDVFYQWKHTGSGRLILKNDDPSKIQYETPRSIDAEEEVVITVTAIDQADRKASNFIVIRLLIPPTPAPTPHPGNRQRC